MLAQLNHGMTVDFARNDKARSRFAMTLRGHVLGDLAQAMRDRYERDCKSGQRRSPKDGVEVHDALLEKPEFKSFSAIRYNAQEMCNRAVVPVVEKHSNDLERRAAAYDEDAPTSGSLTLDPDLQIPNYVANIDVHLMPGGYLTGDGPNDLRAGALYDNAISIFACGRMGKQIDDIGWSMAKFLRRHKPDFRPQKILDLGCTIGHNTLPWAQEYDDAEVHAVDVAAPGLRYAHARAQSLGVPVHFHQQNAERLNFPDNSFDLVFSSMFLHELPAKAIKQALSEAYRVLKPGGLLFTMELPPNSLMRPYDQFYLDWDSHYNNEPFYKSFRDMDTALLCEEAGLEPSSYFSAAVPQYTFMSDEDFANAIRLNPDTDTLANTGRMGKDVNYRYAFGAWKLGSVESNNE